MLLANGKNMNKILVKRAIRGAIHASYTTTSSMVVVYFWVRLWVAALPAQQAVKGSGCGNAELRVEARQTPG